MMLNKDNNALLPLSCLLHDVWYYSIETPDWWESSDVRR